MSGDTATVADRRLLVREIKRWARELGFQEAAITGVDITAEEPRLSNWLAAGYHGDMAYMARNRRKRCRPDVLRPGTMTVISLRMDYMPEPIADCWRVLERPETAYVSRYALGRDYHKVIRGRLKMLGRRIEERIGSFGYRVFTDSAPILERALARNAGLGWVGKHTNLINRRGGSLFFLGEIYTDLALPHDASAARDHCGTCTACIDVCPTAAIVAPYRLDARRCISYLTIEHKGPIPEPLRALIGNRIFGCDDCQLVCPWNKYAKRTEIADFAPRHGLEEADLLALFSWSEADFADRTRGSAIRRVSYAQWLRNIAVALGNAPARAGILTALRARRDHPSQLVREHVGWAIGRQRKH